MHRLGSTNGSSRSAVTGARIVGTVVHRLQRQGARRGLATLCISGGQGMAVALERVED